MRDGGETETRKLRMRSQITNNKLLKIFLNVNFLYILVRNITFMYVSQIVDRYRQMIDRLDQIRFYLNFKKG